MGKEGNIVSYNVLYKTQFLHIHNHPLPHFPFPSITEADFVSYFAKQDLVHIKLE